MRLGQSRFYEDKMIEQVTRRNEGLGLNWLNKKIRQMNLRISFFYFEVQLNCSSLEKNDK